MLFQLDAAIITSIVTVIIVAIIIFLVGVKVTQWYAGKRGWDTSFRTAMIVNLIWLALDIVLGIVLPQAWNPFGIVELVISILIGALVVMQIYSKEFGESIIFVIIIQLILFVIGIILVLILGAIIAIIIVAVMV
jgi:hypothetical protein